MLRFRRKNNKRASGTKLYPALPLMLWVLLTALTMYLFPRQSVQPFRQLRVGEISSQEIIAPFTFDLLKSDEQLEQEREAARQDVEPVFFREESTSEQMLSRLTGSLSMIRQTARAVQTVDTIQGPLGSYGRNRLNRVRSEYNVSLNENAWRYLIEHTSGIDLPIPEPLLRTVLRDVYSRGILNVDLESIETPAGKIRIVSNGEEQTIEPDRLFDRQTALNESLARLEERISTNNAPQDSTLKIAYELLSSFIRPNIIYDEYETEERKESAVAQVPIVKGTVFEEERIIDSNQRVEQIHLDKLKSLQKALQTQAEQEEGFWMGIWPWVGRFLFAGSIFLFLGYWLFRFYPLIYRRPNELMLVWVTLVVMIAMYGFIFGRYDISMFLYPAALGAVILTITFEARIALLYSIVMALIVSGIEGNDLRHALMVLFPAALSIFAVIRVRTRTQIMRSSALIFIGSVLVILIDRTVTLQFGEVLLSQFGYAAIAAVSTPLIALGLLLLVEPIFKVVSDLTLLELADLNRPLLKRLSLEAPGTYHHSIMVGNLAEAAAEKIDANPLLIRAGAYYHDVGKMARREYFVENQAGQANVHDRLEPEESAKMLADHVLKGVEIADKFRVPERIKAFIREHHGTSLMVYFYNKALEMRPEGEVDENDFRYPGPKPQSKETGILMLADSAEAATRSLEDPSEENIREVVREVIINKYRDGELDECPLTLHDLGIIMDGFVPVLQGMHHHRVRYPSREEVQERKKKRQERADAKEADESPPANQEPVEEEEEKPQP